MYSTSLISLPSHYFIQAPLQAIFFISVRVTELCIFYLDTNDWYGFR
jgi:hypothetical protein